MLGVPETVLLVLMLILPIGCIGNWLACVHAWRYGGQCVPNEYRSNVPWGLLDLGVIIVLLTLIAGVGVTAVRSRAGIDLSAKLETLAPQDQATIFLAFGTSTLIATAACLSWILLRFGWHRDLGFSRQTLGADIELGIRWFMMLIVPVVLMQLVLTRWFPTKHPLIEMLRQSGDLSFLPIAAYAAVVSAPLFEEVFFRLFVQGWLEKLQTTMQRTSLGLAGQAERSAVIFGGESSASLTGAPANVPLNQADVAPQNGVVLDDSPNPYRAAQVENSPLGHSHAEAELGVVVERGNHATTDRPILWIPILVSSGLFSLAHFSHGPDWIPLFFLALGLGYLYQRTRRIQACIVVHVLVNSLGVLQLWAAIRQP